ncbi:MAG: Lpg1974 family pore-forming outer membrane protein [Simkaniaceae bacterium]|nr:Lpg1974 family pore-forming outer membrane protein [Simkaniaceae bacterium]
MIVSLLLTSSTAFAAVDIDSRVTQLENQMERMRIKTLYDTQTAAAQVEGKGWSLSFDVFYWHTHISEIEFAINTKSNQDETSVESVLQSLDFKWDWGLRVGLGYNFEHDGWDFKGQYTRYDTNSSRSVSNGSFVITKLPYLTQLRAAATLCANAKSQYNLDYKVLNVELGRVYSMSRKLSFRPYWGLKTAWIDQTQMSSYSGISMTSTNSMDIKDDCKFWGLGPYLGLDSKWHLGYGFSLFNNIAGSLLIGSFDSKKKFSSDSGNTENIADNSQALSPAAQMQIGLCYDKGMRNNTQHIGVRLGFEGQKWWKQNKMLSAGDYNSVYVNQDVNMYGLTLDIQWDF